MEEGALPGRKGTGNKGELAGGGGVEVFQGLFPRSATAVFSLCTFLTDDHGLSFWKSNRNVGDFYHLVQLYT